MKTLKMLCSLLLCAAIPLPALAQPHVIAQLGTAPLIGQIASTPQLQSDVALQRGVFERAGVKLGLSAQEYAAFESRIASRQVAYVTIPRHLDAMSWASGGTVYVVRDVVIPAGTKGWEIDLQEERETVALFVPSRCGNLSIVRRPRPAIARVASPAEPKAVAAVTPAPQPSSSPQPVAASPVVLPQAPAATPAPYQTVAASTPQATHHARLWPLLLLPLLALAAAHHGAPSLPAVGTSTFGAPPPPASCPTPAPSH